MSEPKTLQQQLLERLFVEIHSRLHVPVDTDGQDVPYNKCRMCNALVHEVILSACEKKPEPKPEIKQEQAYDDMGCSAYDAYQED